MEFKTVEKKNPVNMTAFEILESMSIIDIVSDPFIYEMMDCEGDETIICLNSGYDNIINADSTDENVFMCINPRRKNPVRIKRYFWLDDCNGDYAVEMVRIDKINKGEIDLLRNFAFGLMDNEIVAKGA